MAAESKYEIVGRRLAGMTGTLVDVGARDRRLEAFLPQGISYLAADVTPGHDLLWDLNSSTGAANDQYDVTVALDVLEHVERIHAGLTELIRISRSKVFISLPNMTCLGLRWTYFATGRLGAKYDLLPEPAGDRHRWLTSYDQMCAFVRHIARINRCQLEIWDVRKGYGRLHQVVSRLPISPALRAYTVVFEITKGSV
jgi:hypothetical protein